MVQAFLAQLGEDGVKSWVADDGFRMMIRPVGLGADEIDGLLAFASTQPEIKCTTHGCY